MLLVKTRLGPSSISGIGLFADEDIAQGTPTWRFVAGFDIVFTPDDLAALPDHAREHLATYAYCHEPTGNLIYCLDNARFMNHADAPNTKGIHAAGAIDGYDVATRHIARGEEMTCDYRTFDAGFAEKLA